LTDKVQKIAVPVGLIDRLDKVLVLNLPELSRSRIQALIRDEKVKVDGNVITKNGFVVNEGSLIDISIPEPVSSQLVPEDIALDIIFENDDLAVINKPAGMVVHPAAGHSTGTLVHAALSEFDDLDGINGELRPGIVHRLDKDTSGLIIVAKNENAMKDLQEKFKSRKVQKIYLALVDGKPPTPTGRVEAAIARDPSHRKKMAIVSAGRGRASVTEYKTLESYSQHTLIEAHLLTGRTHQIRLHMAFLKCPIVGDKVYGRIRPSVEISRHFLHAARLTIKLPGETKPSTFEAPLPDELKLILDQVR
jgi:23S rRNA pseudouridine1911/1915/1917 synthase